MSKFWMAKILAFSLFCQAGYAFLLDGSTVRPNGESQYLTMLHYGQLMNSLYEEKQARHQLEQIVATLQTKMNAMNSNGGRPEVNITTYIQPYVSRVEKLENKLKAVRTTYDNLLQTKDAKIAKLSSTMAVLEQNYTNLLYDSTVTQANYHRLKLEVEGLKLIKNLDVANGLQETKNDINMLKASNQARSQDFMALYNLTISSKKDIAITKKDLENVYNESVIDKKIKELDDKISRQEMFQNMTSVQVYETLQTLSAKVGFTACDGYMASGSKIKFRTVKSSHGISMASSYLDGKFIAPKAGFYLVLSNILTQNQSSCYIRKNGNKIARALSHWSDSNKTSYFSAPLSAFIELSVNDVITIEGLSLDFSSCLTIVQL